MDWSQRFEHLVAFKSHNALSVSLPPYVTELDLHRPESRAIGNAWSRHLFDGDFYLSPSPDVRLPACSLVFVQSLDHNTGSRDPSSLGGGATDKHLIYEGLSCVAADAVLTGAATIRGGDILLTVWHPELIRLRESLGQPRHPTQIVATLQGIDVDETLLCNVPEVPLVLLTIDEGMRRMRRAIESRPWVTPIVMERPGDLARAFADLRARGLARISAIGGRQLATQLIDAGLVEDLYLTTSPVRGGEPNTPLYPTPIDWPVVLRKRGTGPETGVIFEQFSVRR